MANMRNRKYSNGGIAAVLVTALTLPALVPAPAFAAPAKSTQVTSAITDFSSQRRRGYRRGNDAAAIAAFAGIVGTIGAIAAANSGPRYYGGHGGYYAPPPAYGYYGHPGYGYYAPPPYRVYNPTGYGYWDRGGF